MDAFTFRIARRLAVLSIVLVLIVGFSGRPAAAPISLQPALATAPVASTPPPKSTDTVTGLYVESAYPNEITSVQTTLTVPAKPPEAGTLFLWPGLDPVDGPTFLPIDNGVLQSVLTWGPSCAPHAQPPAYSTWWVSAQYVNCVGHDSPDYTGCHGGPIMPVNVGDSLVMTMTLRGTTWTQVVTDVQTLRSVTYPIDMHGQMQQVLYFVSEGYGQNPVSSVTFTNTSFTFAKPPANGCALAPTGQPDSRDTYSTPVVSDGGTTCSIASITIYSPNGPISASAFRSPQRRAVSGQIPHR